MSTGPSTITNLPTAAAITGTEVMPMDQGGNGLSVQTTINNIVAGGLPSALPTAIAASTATTTIAGTELLPVDQAGTLKKTTVSQFITQATASSAIAGTELIPNTAAGTYQKTTLAQLMLQATPCPSPFQTDIFLATLSNSPTLVNSYRLDVITDFKTVRTAAGTNTYTIAGPPWSAYSAGMIVSVNFTNNNTGPATLNVNSLGAKNIFANIAGTLQALIGSELGPGLKYLHYDGTQFQLLNPSPSVGSASCTGTGFTVGTTPTVTIKYMIQDNMCTLSIPSGLTGTSNAATFTITGLPAICAPVAAQNWPTVLTNNGTVVNGSLQIAAASSTLALGNGLGFGPGSFTTSGTKAFPSNGTFPSSWTYPLTI